MRFSIPFVAAALALSVAACKKEPTTPPQPTAAPTAAPTAEPTASASAAPEVPTAWSDDLTKEQKGAFMKKVVLPAMAPVFQAADAKKYAAFGCKTCHGPDFKDPDEFLPALTVKGDKMTAFADKPDVSKFMMDKVLPEMAKAMGMQPYDPATKKGFGCGGCHKIDMK
ncbi:MAG: hypothetical protein HY908_30015 [Myxococcales bacterium]|nr:hypothetical protein [Myxococcales bacterium]